MSEPTKRTLSLAPIREQIKTLREQRDALPRRDDPQRLKAIVALEAAVTELGHELIEVINKLAGYDPNRRSVHLNAKADALRAEAVEENRLFEASTELWRQLLPTISAFNANYNPATDPPLPADRAQAILHVRATAAPEEQTLIDAWLAADAAYNTAFDQRQAVYKAYRRAYYDQWSARLLTARLQVLAKVRELGHELVNFDEASDPRAIELLRSTAGRWFPRVWLKQEAKSTPMLAIIIADNTRAAYTHKHEMPERTVPPFQLIQDIAMLQLLPSPATEKFVRELQQLIGRDKVNTFRLHTEEGDLIVLTGWDIHVHEVFGIEQDSLPGFDVKPEGEGWLYTKEPLILLGAWLTSLQSHTADDESDEEPDEVLEDPESQSVGEEDLESGFGKAMEAFRKPFWHRPVMSEVALIPTLGISLKIDLRESVLTEDEYVQMQVYHEFTHRIGATYRGNLLGEMERAFLLRKGGMTVDTEFDNLQELTIAAEHTLPGVLFEYAHKIDMVHPYMAKDYLNGKVYEVLATGFAAVFSKEHGSLMNLDEFAPSSDFDHLAFTLGVLAVI
jgi:hypothetical protein